MLPVLHYAVALSCVTAALALLDLAGSTSVSVFYS